MGFSSLPTGLHLSIFQSLFCCKIWIVYIDHSGKHPSSFVANGTLPTDLHLLIFELLFCCETWIVYIDHSGKHLSSSFVANGIC